MYRSLEETMLRIMLSCNPGLNMKPDQSDGKINAVLGSLMVGDDLMERSE